MEKECFDKFRPPQPTDLMDNVSFCSYPWSNKVYCRMWACLRPTDSEEKYEAFSAEAVAQRLRYGCRVASRNVGCREIVIDHCNFGPTEFVVVETIHGQKFMVFPFKFFWGIKPL